MVRVGVWVRLSVSCFCNGGCNAPSASLYGFVVSLCVDLWGLLGYNI